MKEQCFERMAEILYGFPNLSYSLTMTKSYLKIVLFQSNGIPLFLQFSNESGEFCERVVNALKSLLFSENPNDFWDLKIDIVEKEMKDDKRVKILIAYLREKRPIGPLSLMTVDGVLLEKLNEDDSIRLDFEEFKKVLPFLSKALEKDSVSEVSLRYGCVYVTPKNSKTSRVVKKGEFRYLDSILNSSSD